MKRDAFPNGARRIKNVIYFVMIVGCTRQDATHELLRAQAGSASWVTSAGSDQTFETE